MELGNRCSHRVCQRVDVTELMAPFISLNTTPLNTSSLSALSASANSTRCPSWAKSSGSSREKNTASRYTSSRLLNREALAAAQRRVLEYVGDAGRILGHGAQCDEENVFIAVGSEMVVHRTGRFVLVVLHPQVQ